jgi:hypothetical protein
MFQVLHLVLQTFGRAQILGFQMAYLEPIHILMMVQTQCQPTAITLRRGLYMHSTGASGLHKTMMQER